MKTYKFEDFAINCTEKKVPTQEEWKTYIGLEHMDTKSIFITRWGSEVPIIGEKLVMHKGDILFGKRNTYLRRAAIAPHDGVFSAHGMVLRPKTDIVDYDFFALFIASDYFFDKAIQISVGSLSPTVNWKDLKDIEFNLPDMDKQKEIAKVLWSINNTIYSYKEMLKQCDDLVKGQFVEMFGKNKKTVLVKDCCTYHSRIGWQALTTKEHQSTGKYLLITGTDFIDHRINYSTCVYVSKERYDMDIKLQIKNGDILITKDGTIGKVAVVDNLPMCATLNAGIFVVRPDKRFFKEYIEYVFKSDLFQQFIEKSKTGATIKHLNQNKLENFEIILPEITKQQEFAEFCKHLDKSKFAIKKAMNNAKKILDGILRENLC